MEAEILIQVDNVSMHKFVSEEKILYTKGVLKIAQIQNSYQPPVHYLNINSFYFTLSKTVKFAKIQFQNTVSYLFQHFDQGLSTITIDRNEEIISSLEKVLQNVANLQNFNVAIHDDLFYQKVQRNCPFIDREPIVISSKLKGLKNWTTEKLVKGIKNIGMQIAQGFNSLRLLFKRQSKPSFDDSLQNIQRIDG